MKLGRPPEAVFSARVEYGYEERNQGKRLGPGRPSNSERPIERLEQDLRAIVDSELPNDMSSIFGVPITTRVIAVREGSIVVFFGVVLSAVGVFSSYSDFFESVHLVRKHAAMLVERLVRNKYNGSWDVQVSIEHPRLPDPGDMGPWRRLRGMFGPEADEFARLAAWISPSGSRSREGQRDGFFWYLLFSNLLLLAALAWLLSAAVMKTYFS